MARLGGCVYVIIIIIIKKVGVISHGCIKPPSDYSH